MAEATVKPKVSEDDKEKKPKKANTPSQSDRNPVTTDDDPFDHVVMASD